MIEDAVAVFCVRHDDVLKAAIALVLLDCLFKQPANEGWARESASYG